ncbi:hypothetical protein QLH51_16860, partial [Sphingomonas sp. 2R-10]|uniref:hypothetical protein n=1 Tax=Sphingomonas sp. 2R-10 TaxID=3045148 RepID=UPI0024BA6ADB
PAPARIGAAYRSDASPDSYLLAISDSARGAWISPDVIARDAGESKGQTVRQWTVAFYDPGSIATYAPMTGLPAPDTVLAALGRPMIARTNSWGKKLKIDINAAATK